MAKRQELFDAISEGDRKTTARLVQAAVDNKENLEEVLADSMIAAMKEVGDRFSKNEIFVPEMLIAARAMQSGLNIVEPILTKKGHEPVGRVCIATVRGDLHDIGKNVLAMMLKSAGWHVIDLGVDCDVERFQRAVDDEGAQAICCSALVTTTMDYMKTVVEHFSRRSNAVKVFVGGAPVTQAYADHIGADGYAKDASAAVRLISEKFGVTA